MKQAQTELFSLVARRDALGELLTDLQHAEWEQRMRDYNILSTRIEILRERLANVRFGMPEFGRAFYIEPARPIMKRLY